MRGDCRQAENLSTRVFSMGGGVCVPWSGGGGAGRPTIAAGEVGKDDAVKGAASKRRVRTHGAPTKKPDPWPSWRQATCLSASREVSFHIGCSACEMHLLEHCE